MVDRPCLTADRRFGYPSPQPRCWRRSEPERLKTQIREAEITKVLVIDDNAEMRTMMVRALSNAHHEVIESEDGVDGLRKFRGESPTIVITDIIMPHRDGLETIREMRDAGSKTGIIAISGGGVGAGALYLSISKDYGVDAILQKPFRASELIAAVDEVLGKLNPAG